MVQRIGGARRKTRAKFSKPMRQQGKISLRRYLQKLETGEKVVLQAEPGVQSGLYFRRFHGKIGTVRRRLGSCYEVVIMDNAKEKLVIVHPVHLKKVVR